MPKASNQTKMFRFQTGEEWHNLWSWCKSADILGDLWDNRNCWLSTFDGRVFESNLMTAKKTSTNLPHTKPGHVVSTQHTLIVSSPHTSIPDHGELASVRLFPRTLSWTFKYQTVTLNDDVKRGAHRCMNLLHSLTLGFFLFGCDHKQYYDIRRSF